MSATEDFFDTKVLLYLLSADGNKASRAEALVALGGTVSVQVLNEFAAVASRKLRMRWPEIREALEPLTAVCTVTPVTLEVHQRGLQVAERYGFALYDAMVVAAALMAGCKTLYSEDMQHGQVIEQRLRICNPFIA